MPRHDIAIYSPFARLYYEPGGKHGGGAELQTTLLAAGLAGRGFRVAHIIYPLRVEAEVESPAPTLVERSAWQGGRRLGQLHEARAIMSALAAADARAYIVRGSGGHLIPAAAFCRVRRRRLVFSTSNDLDFDFARPDRRPQVLRAYRSSIRHADRVVVQTTGQIELATATVEGIDPILIPSFCEPAEPARAEPEYFLWADRLVEYKRPLGFLDLAEAVPEARFRMVLAPTSETPAELERQIRDRAVGLENVEIVPQLPRDELLEVLTRAAAMVSTSRAEGMPNTFLEAWARGIPVLSLSVDPDDRLTEKGIGIVAGDSTERFVAGARLLWSDRSVRAEMGERARAFVRETHAPEAVVDRWQALLDDLLQRR